ncbi:hypothetical protein QF031_000347 [Pseudarthrobacter defluvii]|uniref:hypothetical protein n=1 Tax=Pseudarthrobacter defluvii TaxID=410837 RepID=UPI0027848407|nr:hypothetical protein [Pseudarthrobacter defluvii]MDQ0767598.1 hypothetical protein [Pseudarthrobacter defluvii]
MAARRIAKRCGAASEHVSRRFLGCLAAVLLAAAGCSPGGSTPAGSPSGSPQHGSPSPATSGPGATAPPSRPFTDAELAAIINGVGKSRNLPVPAAQDSTRLRSGAAGGSVPAAKTETTPGDCIAFMPQDPFTRWADKDINFAEGAMPPAGGQSGPASTIMVVLRSAEKAAIAKADFGYPDDLVSRCGQFDLAYTESGRTSTYAVQLLAAPPLGEKQHAFMQVTKPKGPGDFGSVGLRVLDGTLSVTLTLGVANLSSGSDARPALDAMNGLANELMAQAGKDLPTVAPPPANSLSPDQLVALFRGMTGPGGEPVSLPQAMIVGASPGFTPGASSQPPDPPCTFNEESYAKSLTGSVSGQGMIQGASKIDYTDFMVVSMPSTAAPPYPFDARSEQLRGCTSVQESSFGGGSWPWSAVSELTMALPADASYAVAYQLSDGTGEWHVRSGARRGTLSIEASSRTAAQSETQAKADALAAFFGAVFSRAGK